MMLRDVIKKILNMKKAKEFDPESKEKLLHRHRPTNDQDV